MILIINCITVLVFVLFYLYYLIKFINIIRLKSLELNDTNEEYIQCLSIKDISSQIRGNIDVFLNIKKYINQGKKLQYFYLPAKITKEPRDGYYFYIKVFNYNKKVPKDIYYSINNNKIKKINIITDYLIRFYTQNKIDKFYLKINKNNIFENLLK